MRRVILLPLSSIVVIFVGPERYPPLSRDAAEGLSIPTT